MWPSLPVGGLFLNTIHLIRHRTAIISDRHHTNPRRPLANKQCRCDSHEFPLETIAFDSQDSVHMADNTETALCVSIRCHYRNRLINCMKPPEIGVHQMEVAGM